MNMTPANSASNLNWKIPPCSLVYIPERDRLTSPVCDFEPDYPELASYEQGQLWARWGYVLWCKVSTKEQENGALGKWDSLDLY